MTPLKNKVSRLCLLGSSVTSTEFNLLFRSNSMASAIKDCAIFSANSGRRAMRVRNRLKICCDVEILLLDCDTKHLFQIANMTDFSMQKARHTDAPGCLGSLYL